MLVGVSAGLVLTWSEGPDTKRALTGTASRVARRRAAPPTRRSDIVDNQGVKEWGLKVNKTRSNRGGRLFIRSASHGTPEKGLAWSWQQTIPTSRLPNVLSSPRIISQFPRFLSTRIAVCSFVVGLLQSVTLTVLFATDFLTLPSPDKMSYIVRRGLSTLIPPKVRTTSN